MERLSRYSENPTTKRLIAALGLASILGCNPEQQEAGGSSTAQTERPVEVNHPEAKLSELVDHSDTPCDELEKGVYVDGRGNYPYDLEDVLRSDCDEIQGKYVGDRYHYQEESAPFDGNRVPDVIACTVVDMQPFKDNCPDWYYSKMPCDELRAGIHVYQLRYPSFFDPSDVFGPSDRIDFQPPTLEEIRGRCAKLAAKYSAPRYQYQDILRSSSLLPPEVVGCEVKDMIQYQSYCPEEVIADEVARSSQYK